MPQYPVTYAPVPGAYPHTNDILITYTFLLVELKFGNW